MASNPLGRGSSSNGPLLRPVSLELSTLIVLSPRLRDLTNSPTPNGFEFSVNNGRGGVLFEASADYPQRGNDYDVGAVS